MFKSLPYDSVDGFRHGLDRWACSTSSSWSTRTARIKTVGDVIAAAKQRPGPFQYRHDQRPAARRTSPSLMFTSMAGLEVPTVPFRTTGDVVPSLISGQIQVGVRDPARRASARSGPGKLRALAVASDKPVGVPAGGADRRRERRCRRSGLVSWNGFVVPAKTPRDIVTAAQQGNRQGDRGAGRAASACSTSASTPRAEHAGGDAGDLRRGSSRDGARSSPMLRLVKRLTVGRTPRT